MSSNVLIGVGGSGQHVVHAYLNLLALGNTPASEVPFVFIIDADVTDSSPLYHSIKKLHHRLTSPLNGSKNKATLNVTRPYPSNNADQSKTSEQALGLANTETWLADAFLIDDADFSQFSDKNIKINEGMMANARIGSAVFSATNPLEKLRQVVTDKQVAIVGSTFGGTGSGVIPTLVRLLDKQENPPKNVRAFMTLPWFEITGESSKGKSAAHALGSLSPMKRNAALGLRTYKQELSGFTRSNYVITQFLSGQQAKRPDDGNFEQTEHKHVFNLVLANAIQNFFYEPSQTIGQLMTLRARGEEINGVYSAATSVNLRFLRLFLDSEAKTNRNEVSLEGLMINTELVALVLEKAALFINKGDKQFKIPNADSAKEPEGLKSFIKALYKSNYGDLPKSTFGSALSLGIKNLVGTAVPQYLEAIYSELAKAITVQANILRNSLVWLRDHIESEQNKTGLKTLQTILPLFSGKTEPYGSLSETELTKGEHKKVYWRSDRTIKNMQGKSELSVEKTDKITLAYNIFLNTFYQQEGQGAISDNGHEAELQKRIEKDEVENDTPQQKEQRSYAVAAQLLAEKIYEQVVLISKLVSESQHNADEQSAKEMLNGFKTLSTTQDNHVFFKFAQNDLGLLDNGQTGEEHPYSIRYLDPFLGIQNVKDLIKQPSQPEAKAVFLETALKGVPNIIAPLLVQKWRLALLSDPQIQQDPSFKNKESLTKTEPPLSTPYGIYLHARRVIEAAFWLLFNQDNRVLLVSNDSPTEGSFVNIVNSELNKYKDTTLHPEGLKPLKYFIKSTVNGRPLFLYDDTYGWYLAANKTARQFFASIMPELPSVKYGHSKLDSLWRGEEYQSTPMSKQETYDTGVINAFLAYVKQLSELQPQPQWSNVIQDLINDLHRKGFSPTDLITLQMNAVNLPLSGRADALELKSLDNVKNTSLLSLAIPNPIFYYKTDNNDNLSPLKPKELLWPLKGEAWKYLVPPKEDAINAFGEYKLLSNDTRSVWSWETLHLNFKGLGKKTFNKPFDHVVGVDAREDQFLWSVGVWPNFVLDDWNYYIAIGDFNSVEIKNIDLRGYDLKAETVEFIFYGDTNGQFQELGRSLHAIPIKLKGVPRSVEIVLRGRVLGSVPISLKKQSSNNTGECSIALDFGTSNTCMAIKISGEDEVYTLPLLEGQEMATDDGNSRKPCNLAEMTWSTGNYLSGKKYYHQLLPTLFFQSFAAQATQSAAIPSELLWAKGLGAGNSDRRIEFLQGVNQIKDYYSKFSLLEKFGHSDPKNDFNGELPIVVPFWTAFPPAINQSLREALARTDGNNRYVDNFKWPNVALGDRRYGYRAAYLESIMVACFATLRLAGYKRVNQLIATYPGAFTKKDTNVADTTNDQQRSQKVALADTTSYEQDLQNIVNALTLQMGVSFTDTDNKILLRSETCAALAGCHREARDIALTIDMGGGTTDIGLLIPLMVDGKETVQSYMASLRYAGNDLLKAIVAYDLTKSENKDKKRDTQLLDWKLSLREGTKRGSGTDTQAYNRIAMAFFEGLFEYIFNLLTAYQTNLYDKPINVYLLGNGFRLAQYFCCAGAVGKEKEEELAFFKQMQSKAKTVNALPNNITLQLKQQGLDKKRALIEGVFNVKTGTSEGAQYLAIEDKGYDAQPLLLPCVRVGSSTAYTQPVLIEKKDMKDVKIATDRPTRESAFKLTNKYWQHQDVNPDALFTQIVLATDGADLGKFYLENKFVPEVLCKLIKEQDTTIAQQPQIQVNVSIPAPPPTPPQQSGFKPSAVSESVAAPPAPNVPPPQNSNNSAGNVRLSSGANTPIDGNNISITLNWHSPFELDVIVFALNDKGKVTADENTIFYNQPSYAQGAVELNNEQRQVHINLSQIPAHIKTIAICAVTGIDDESARGKTFGQVSHSKINVSGANNIIFELNNVKGTETAMIFGEVYRHNNTWKFRAKGQGYAGGFKKMCDEYGAEY